MLNRDHYPHLIPLFLFEKIQSMTLTCHVPSKLFYLACSGCQDEHIRYVLKMFLHIVTCISHSERLGCWILVLCLQEGGEKDKSYIFKGLPQHFIH